jgi:hypothetical protein
MAKKNEHAQARGNVIYKNLDLYPTDKNGPGLSFYQELYKYKSVQDYLNKKRKKKKNKKIKRRKNAFLSIASFDSQTTPLPMDPGIPGANQIGGVADHVTQQADQFGNPPGNNLNYAVSKDFWEEIDQILSESANNLENFSIPLNSAESPLHGMPDGIIGEEDRDYTHNLNNNYGITNSGNQYANGVPFPTQKR